MTHCVISPSISALHQYQDSPLRPKQVNNAKPQPFTNIKIYLMDNLPHLKLMPIFRLILHLSRAQEVPLCPSSDLYGAFLFLRFDIEQQAAS